MGLVKSSAAALMCGVALGAMGVQGAAAQSDNVNAGNVTLLERLVIGAGAPKVAIDTPQAVTVVNQADIDQAQATTIGEVLDTVPGVTMIGSERVLGESVQHPRHRYGRNLGRRARASSSPSTAAKKFYEQYRMGSFFSDPELYKQVEVLRGPASSTLYGSGALAGVINFITKDASDFIKRRPVRRGAGQDPVQLQWQWHAAVGHSGPSDHRYFRSPGRPAIGAARRSSTWPMAVPLSGSDFDALFGPDQGHGAVRRQRRADHAHVLSALEQRRRGPGLCPDRHRRPRSAWSTAMSPTRPPILSYENADSDNPLLDIKANLSFSDTEVVQDNSAVGPIGDAEYGYRTYQANIQNTSEFSGENWENFLTYGVQASYQDRNAISTLTNGPISTHPEGQDSRLGLFVQNEAIFDDRLTIIAGTRGDFVWQTPEETGKGEHDIEDFAFSPKIAALYDLTDNISVFGSVAHTERLPTLDELYQFSGSRTISLGLEKESSNNFEVGFALSGDDVVMQGDEAAIKTTAFYSDISNLIEANPSGFVGPYFANITNATIYGVEVEGSYESEFFFSRLAYTATAGENADTGADLTSIPAHKVVLTVGGRAPEFDLEYGVKATLAASADTGVTPSAGGSSATDGYLTADVFASWKPSYGALEGTEARFSIENIFDADYRDNQNPDRSLGRTFKLTLAKQFDY